MPIQSFKKMNSFWKIRFLLVSNILPIRWIVWFVVFVSCSLDRSRNKSAGKYILRISVFLVVVTAIHLEAKKMNVWSTMEMRNNVVEAVQAIILFRKELLVLWWMAKWHCRTLICFLCLRLFRVLEDVRRLSTVGNWDLMSSTFVFCYWFSCLN